MMGSGRPQPVKRQYGRGQAPIEHAAQDLPVDGSLLAMNPSAEDLRDGREPHVRAHRDGGRNPKEEDHDRRHERSAADTGQPDQQADPEAGRRIDPIESHSLRLAVCENNAAGKIPARAVMHYAGLP